MITLHSSGERFSSLTDTDGLEEKIRIFPTVVEPKTFRSRCSTSELQETLQNITICSTFSTFNPYPSLPSVGVVDTKQLSFHAYCVLEQKNWTIIFEIQLMQRHVFTFLIDGKYRHIAHFKQHYKKKTKSPD